MKLSEFLDAVASPSPTPGGGSASALLCSLGASLLCMVCNLTIGKKGYEESEAELKKVLEEAEKLRMRSEELIDEDTKAFDEVMAAYKTPKEAPGRAERIQSSLKNAVNTPLEVAKIGVRVLELSKIVAFKGNVNSISDAGVAALAAEAGVRGAILNVKINLKSITDKAFNEEKQFEIKNIERNSKELLEEVAGIVSFKLGN
ncbi:MAG: cyclodeaminase/cyclohydrolase family protein [Candidatus Micrarchaeia archaeon]